MTATQAKAAEGTAEVPEEPKKSKKKLVIIFLVVALLGGFIAKKEFLKPHYKPGQAVPAGKVDPLDQLTINLSDGHMAQVTVVLQLSKLAKPKKITLDVSAFEDAVTTVFGDDTYKVLLTPAGRLAAKTDILKRCQKITGTLDGAGELVTAVYFDGFVLQ